MPGNPLSDPNWAAELTDTVVRVVGTVRDRTTNNVVLVARAVVFGVLAAILGVIALTLLLLVLTRALQALLDIAKTAMLVWLCGARARKKLVPGAEARALAIYDDRKLVAVGRSKSPIGVALHQRRQFGSKRLLDTHIASGPQ